MTSLRFDSTDLGVTEEFLSRTYTKMQIGGWGESTRARVARDAAEEFSIDAAAFDYDIAHRATEPLGRVAVCCVYDGEIERRVSGGETGRFGAGDVFVYAGHDRPYEGVTRRARYSIVMLAPELLGRVVAADPDGSRIVRLTGDRPTSDGAAEHLRRVVAHLRDDVLTDPVAGVSPLIVSAATQLIAASVLATFPHEVLGDPDDDRAALPATMRRAMSFIDAHAAEPITLEDIAAAAGTTGRSIQAAFRRHRDTTPMAYLRRVRLAAAHRDLVAADPGETTVADIAARWGFAPAGRFAAHYQREYGRHPSATLRG